MQCSITKGGPGGDKSFNVCNVHRFCYWWSGSAGRRPQPHFAYSHVTVRQEQRASCIYSVFISVPMHKNSPAAAYVQTCFFPLSLRTCLSAFTELPSLTHLLLRNYSKSGRDNVAVVISCISQHQHHTFSFLRLKRWDSITCCQDSSILRSRVFAGEPASRMTPLPPPSSPSTPFHPFFFALRCCECWERRVRSKHASAGRLSWTPGAGVEKGWNP